MTDSSEKTHVAVIGVGEHGRNHARALQEIAGAELVGVYDVCADRRREAASKCGVRAFETLDEALAAVQAVSVVIPAREHANAARRAFEQGVDALIEKPITRAVEEADELIELAAARKRILQVGHVERFNPGVLPAKALTRSPLFFEIHRLGVFTPRSLDVDVGVCLMSHNLAPSRWMVES